MGAFDHDVAAVARIGAVPTILQVISETTGLGLTLVARVTREAWIACAVRDEIAFGLKPGDPLDVATTLCSEVRDSLEPIIIEHASEDPKFCHHPTPKLYNFESYIAVPIFHRSGAYFGNLCGLDPRPAKLRAPKTLAMMRLFSELISLQLHDQEELARTGAALAEAEQTAELRELFFAVLGHDLRNPLWSIGTAAEILISDAFPDRVRSIADRIRRSVRRIELLIDDMLDLTRGRLGGGLVLRATEISDLEACVRHVVDEVASLHPKRTIHFRVEGQGSVVCDRRRIEQVVSNLLSNAIQHGSSPDPVEVALRHERDEFVIAVSNRGAPIPEGVLPRLFQPFYRAASGGPRDGLGLGLFIVSEIANAHGGKVDVASSERDGTTFTVRLPRRAHT
jgi:signal transduction histidine kinase